MEFDPSCFTIDEVKEYLDTYKALLMQLYVTTDYTVEAVSVRKQKQFDLEKMIDICQTFIVENDPNILRPDTSTTVPNWNVY